MKGSVPFVIALAFFAAPAAQACDAALEAQVAAKPADTDARDALARSCARAGRALDALHHYDLLLAVDADNADWLLGKSQALIVLGRPREALPLLARARERAPAYEDVWRVNANALDQLEEFAAADALLTQAAAQFPEAAWPRERQAALAERRLREQGMRLSADLSYEELSGGRPPWKGASLGLDKPLGDKRHVFAGLHLEERFDIQDTQFLLGYADRLDADWAYAISADLAPDAQNLPEWSLSAEAGRALPEAFSLGLRLRHAHHATVDVDNFSATVEKYFGQFSLAYSLNVAKVSGISDPHYGHVLRAAHEYGDGSRAALVIGFGEEAETVAPGVVQVTQTNSVALAGLHWTSTAWGFAWEAGWYEQGDLYDRIRVRLGFEHRF
jgi:YaiO family outer membrane protein